MSSLAATQADGYYIPPAAIDAGKSKNQLAGSRGHNQFLQRNIVRFELPYKGICRSCKTSIGRGTRFNAKKTKTDQSYFTTPIYEFLIKCRQAGCQQSFRIRTNPQQRGFDYVEGITIQQGQDLQLDGAAAGAAGAAALAPTSRIDASYLSSLERLETVACGKRKTMSEYEELQQLQKLNASTYLPDADSNARIRAIFRSERKSKKERLAQASRKGWRRGMELLAATPNDRLQSEQTIFGNGKQKERERLATVRKSSIFPATPPRQKRRRFRSGSLLSSSWYNVSGSCNESVTLPPTVVSSSSINSATEQGWKTSNNNDNKVKEEDNTRAESLSFHAMLAGYGSESEEEDGK
jgi:coiled-coil domain-containing protein 130